MNDCDEKLDGSKMALEVGKEMVCELDFIVQVESATLSLPAKT